MSDPNPTRVPSFFTRRWSSAENVDRLTCPECATTMPPFAAGDLPPVRSLLACGNCGLESKVPALQSQAGLGSDARPSTDDRS